MWCTGVLPSIKAGCLISNLTLEEIRMSDTNRTVEVTADDLPLHCPRPNAPLWSQHPRVFLDVTHTGEVVCPYCGTHYVFKGELPKGHH